MRPMVKASLQCLFQPNHRTTWPRTGPAGPWPRPAQSSGRLGAGHPWVYSNEEKDWLYFYSHSDKLYVYSVKYETWREMTKSE